MSTCGVEIGPKTIKYVVLKGGGRRCVAARHGRVVLAAGQSAADAMRELRDRGEIPSRVRVASGLDMGQLRHISLPPMPARELRQAIQHEIDRESGIVDEGMASGYQILGRETDGRRSVLIAQTPRAAIESLEKEIVAAGFQIETLTTSSVALLSYALTKLDLSDPDQAITVVHLGDGRMLLAVLERGRIRLMRDLGLGLDASLLGTLELDATGTTGTPVGDGVDWDLLEGLSRGLSEVAQVAGQIRRTLEHDSQQSPIRPVVRMLLAGDVTRAEALVPLIANEIDLPIELLDPSHELVATADDPFDGEGPSYALPFALAKLRNPRAPLHLGRFPRAGSNDLLRNVALATVAVGLLGVLVSFFIDPEVRRLEEARRALDDEITVLEGAIGASAEPGGLAETPGTLRSLMENPSPREVLRWAASAVPARETIDELSLLRDGPAWKVSMEGSFHGQRGASGVLDWSRFLQHLENERRIRDLEVPRVVGDSQSPEIPVSVGFTWVSER